MSCSLTILAALILPAVDAEANSPIQKLLEWHGGVWEVVQIDGLHTAPTCVITLSGKEARDKFVVDNSADCPIKAISASTGWSWGLRFYDSSGNHTVSFTPNPDQETYGANSPGYGRLIMRKLSRTERVKVCLTDLSRHAPIGLAAASVLILGAAARWRLGRHRRKAR